jgi:hypothetical protein
LETPQEEAKAYLSYTAIGWMDGMDGWMDGWMDGAIIKTEVHKLFLNKDEIVFVRECTRAFPLIAREWTNQSAPTVACLFIEIRKRFQKGQNSDRLY